MKLVRYNHGRIGVVVGERVYDVTSAAEIDAQAWPPIGMVQLIADFARKRWLLEAAIQGPGTPLDAVKLETPIPWCNKVIAYPVNYRSHGAEMAVAYRADTRGFFLKAPSSLSGAGEPIVLPDLPGRRIDHEGELAIIIGKQVRHVSAAEALDCVFGYSCLLDIVVRGEEERVMRKSYDTFTPMGPWLVTADEVGDPSALELKLWVGEELRQHANTRDLILDVPGMIVMAASVMTLYPGDIIASGTPAGVGPIADGDLVTLEIERVGRLTVPVRQGRGGANLAMQPKPSAASGS